MYRITHSLLSSWIYYLEHGNKDEFISVLKREVIPDNEHFQRGRKFEQDCVDGKVKGISEIIEGGCYQVRATKKININGYDLLLVGVLDVLKAGIIYDIKSTMKYDAGKFYESTQHPMYFELVPEAEEFVYLIESNGNIFYEAYNRDETRDIKIDIKCFLDYLGNNPELLDIYLEKWEEEIL